MISIKKPIFWVLLIVATSCIATIVCFIVKEPTSPAMKATNSTAAAGKTNDTVSTTVTDATTNVTLENDKKQNPYFNATVLEVNVISEKDGKFTGTVTVEPATGSDELKSSDKINVNLDVVSTHPVPDMKKGDKIRIIYNGEIAETYPAQVNTPFAIYALDADGNVISATPTTETTK